MGSKFDIFDYKEPVHDIAEHYGMLHQADKCCEELAELAAALLQFKDGRTTIYDIASEIADVEIMTEQMKFFFGIHSIVDDEKEIKIRRQLERIKIERKNNEQRKHNRKTDKRPRD